MCAFWPVRAGHEDLRRDTKGTVTPVTLRHYIRASRASAEMYVLSVASYDVNHVIRTIRARGAVRSITKMAGILIDDATFPYLAATLRDLLAAPTRAAPLGRAAHAPIAAGPARHPHSCYLSFTTRSEDQGNPLATPSSSCKGWSMSGGSLIGEISIISEIFR